MFSSVKNDNEESPQSLPSSMVQARVSSVSSVSTPNSFDQKAQKDDDSAVAHIDKIEQRTKASINKLKHILCNVKTRPGDGSLYSMKLDGEKFCPPKPSRTEVRIQRLRDMGLFNENFHQSKKYERCNGCADVTADDATLHSFFPEEHVQHDQWTSTKTTITFDKTTKAAHVTIIASIDENPAKESFQKSLISAARAIAQSAIVLEEKANVAMLSSKVQSTSLDDTLIDETMHKHDNIVSGLAKAKILEGTQVRKGYYAGTPFRPVYKVKLELPDGSIVEALLKPATPGDVHCRWGNASSDWVAYKVGRLLGTDMVPPAAMRRDVKIGEKSFPLATLLYLVPNVKPLTRLSLQEWGGELPAVFVSNAHILDALLGSCPRARNMFMEGPSWTQGGTRQAMLLDHPMGPGQGKLHPMWTQRGQICGIKCISRNTLANLRNLNKTLLVAALGKWVSPIEVDHILERLEQVLAYFNAMSQYGSRLLAIV